MFFEHYGGPHSADGQQGLGRAARSRRSSSKGYIYFEIDNRGSPIAASTSRSTIYRAMGSVEVEDQKAGAEYLKTLPFVDPKKIAIYGWSYGGYMTLKMLEADPRLLRRRASPARR